MKPIRIKLSRQKGWRMPENTVKVDRSTKYGNPFVPGKTGPMGRSPIDKVGSVGCFADMMKDPELRAAAGYPSDEEIRRDLGGKNLGCWCEIGECCHAEILLPIANPFQFIKDYYESMPPLNPDDECNKRGVFPSFKFPNHKKD